MKHIRLVVAALAAAVIAIVGLSVTLGASGAGAATTPAGGYPPTNVCSAQLSISSTTAFPGEQLTVDGSGFVPGSTVQLILTPPPAGVVVATVIVPASGSFETHITIPLGATGNEQLTVANSAVEVCPPDPIQIVSNGVSGSSTSNNPGGTAFTGVKIMSILLGAAALLGGGVLLTTAGRRRSGSGRHTG